MRHATKRKPEHRLTIGADVFTYKSTGPAEWTVYTLRGAKLGTVEREGNRFYRDGCRVPYGNLRDAVEGTIAANAMPAVHRWGWHPESEMPDMPVLQPVTSRCNVMSAGEAEFAPLPALRRITTPIRSLNLEAWANV